MVVYIALQTASFISLSPETFHADMNNGMGFASALFTAFLNVIERYRRRWALRKMRAAVGLPKIVLSDAEPEARCARLWDLIEDD